MNEATRALERLGRKAGIRPGEDGTRERDGWMGQRLNYLVGEQARLKGSAPLRRFLRGATATYRRFLFSRPTPPTVFTASATIHTISAGLDQLERSRASHKDPESTPDNLDSGQALAADLVDRVP
jgi:hypothetical protein